MAVIITMIITMEMMIWLKKVVVVVVEVVEVDTIKVVVVMDVAVVALTSKMEVITTAIVKIFIILVMKTSIEDRKKTTNKLNSPIMDVEADKDILILQNKIKNIMIMILRAAAASQLPTHLKSLKTTTMEANANKTEQLITKDTTTHTTDYFSECWC